MNTKTASISEIFSSLQGEGTHMGERHLFVRFEKCNIHCEYCDEIDKVGAELDLDSIIAQITNLEREEGPHSFISLTGGEPLVYQPFLQQLCPILKSAGFKLYLETNGILWRQLEEVLSFIDVIAMDLKPASVTKDKSFIQDHKKFLQLTKSKETFIKIIVSKEIDIREFQELCNIVREIRDEMTVILQPISEKDREGHEDPELMRLLCELQRIARGILKDVRILPRLHRILKIK